MGGALQAWVVVTAAAKGKRVPRLLPFKALRRGSRAKRGHVTSWLVVAHSGFVPYPQPKL